MIRKYLGKVLSGVLSLTQSEVSKKQDRMESLTVEDVKNICNNVTQPDLPPIEVYVNDINLYKDDPNSVTKIYAYWKAPNVYDHNGNLIDNSIIGINGYTIKLLIRKTHKIVYTINELRIEELEIVDDQFRYDITDAISRVYRQLGYAQSLDVGVIPVITENKKFTAIMISIGLPDANYL